MTTLKTPFNCILLIDDDDITNFINERVIGSLQIANSVTALENGKEGIGFVKKYYEVNRFLPELIFLDLNMPIMNGFEFLEEYHKSGFNGSTVIAVLTTSENPDDLNRLKELGINYILNKPLTQEKLEGLLKKDPLLKKLLPG